MKNDKYLHSNPRKSVNFSDQERLFEYSGRKSNDNNEEDLLLSPSPQKLTKRQEIKTEIEISNDSDSDSDLMYKSVLEKYNTQHQKDQQRRLEQEELKKKSAAFQQKNQQTTQTNKPFTENRQNLSRDKIQEVTAAIQNIQIAQPIHHQSVKKMNNSQNGLQINAQEIVTSNDRQFNKNKQMIRNTIDPLSYFKTIAAKCQYQKDEMKKNQQIMKMNQNVISNRKVTLDPSSISYLIHMQDKEQNIQKIESKLTQTSISIFQSYLNEAPSRIHQLEQQKKMLLAALNKARAKRQSIENRGQQITKRRKEIMQRRIQSQERVKRMQVELNFNSYMENKRALWYQEVQLKMKILKFHVDQTIFNSQLILDQQIYIKIRQQASNRADIRVINSAASDLNPPEYLIEIKSRVQILKTYFGLRLDRIQNPYQMLSEISYFYQILSTLDRSLLQLINIFTIDQLNVTSNYQKLNFKLTIKPKCTFFVTVYIYKITESAYYDIYHIEGKQNISVHNQEDENDFLNIIKSLLKIYCSV